MRDPGKPPLWYGPGGGKRDLQEVGVLNGGLRCDVTRYPVGG